VVKLKAIPALIELLRDKDVNVREAAKALTLMENE
jgi:HEAT repeat protein